MKNSKDKKIKYTNAKETAEKQNTGFGPRCIRLSKETSQFKPKTAKNYRLDVIPFYAKKGNPIADEGDVHWERTFYVHARIGAEEQDYCCLLKNWGKPCPACEMNRKFSQQGDLEKAKSLFWKKKQLIAVRDLEDPDKGVQVYYGPYSFGIGELIDNKINASSDGSRYRGFFHLEDGQTLVITYKQNSFMGQSYMKPVNLEMEDRRKQYDESMLEEGSICLDDLLIELPYDKLKNILLQGEEGENGDEEKNEQDKPSAGQSARKSGKAEAEEEEEGDSEGEDNQDDDGEAPKGRFKVGDLVTYKKKEYEVVRVSPDGTSLTLEDEDEKQVRNVDPDFCEPVKTKESEREEIPDLVKDKVVLKRPKPKPKDEDAWDDEEPEEEEEPAPRKRK